VYRSAALGAEVLRVGDDDVCLYGHGVEDHHGVRLGHLDGPDHHLGHLDDHLGPQRDDHLGPQRDRWRRRQRLGACHRLGDRHGCLDRQRDHDYCEAVRAEAELVYRKRSVEAPAEAE
jgi:hypothetical protein